MPASKEDFVAHQHKNEHKLAEQNHLAKFAKHQAPPAAPVKLEPSSPNLVPAAMSVPRTASLPPQMSMALAALIQPPKPAPMQSPALTPVRMAVPMSTSVDLIRSIVHTELNKSIHAAPSAIVAPSNLAERKYLVLVERIAWTATKKQVLTFFDGVRIVNGMMGINFIVPDERGKSNNAFVEVATYDDYERMRRFEQKVDANADIGRYIQGKCS